MMPSTLDTHHLTQLLAQKCELMVQLRQLVGRQYTLIDGSDLTQLLNLLAVKQGLIGKLQTLQRQLDPYRGQLPQERRWSSEADRQQCAQLADASQRLLGEIMDIEKQSESQLILRRDEAATQLHAAHFAAQAHVAYVKPSVPNISQVDLSSE